MGWIGVAVEREPLAAARRRAATTLLLGAVSGILLAFGLASVLARRVSAPESLPGRDGLGRALDV